jgi:hypothetical protein
MHTYTHLYMHTCTHIHTYTHIYAHIHTHIPHIYIHIYIIHIYIIHIHIHTYIYTHIYVHTHTYTHMHTHIHTCTHKKKRVQQGRSPTEILLRRKVSQPKFVLDKIRTQVGWECHCMSNHSATSQFSHAHIGLKRIDMIVISIRIWVG